MTRWSRLRSWLRATLERSRMESEMDAELRFHIEAAAEDLGLQLAATVICPVRPMHLRHLRPHRHLQFFWGCLFSANSAPEQELETNVARGAVCASRKIPR
jgi:hypothetical protein